MSELAKLKVVLEASTSAYRKGMEQAKKETQSVRNTIQGEFAKIKQVMTISKPFRVPVDAEQAQRDLKEVQEEIRKTQATLEEYQAAAKEWDDLGVPRDTSSAFQNLEKNIESATQKLEEYQAEEEKLQENIESVQSVNRGIRQYIKNAQVAAGIRVYTDEFEDLNSDVERSIQTLEQLRQKKREMLAEGSDENMDALGGINEQIEGAERRLEAFRAKMAILQNSGQDTKPVYTGRLSDGNSFETAGAVTKQTTQRIREIRGSVNEAIKSVPVLGKVLSNAAYLGSKGWGGLTRIIKGVGSGIATLGSGVIQKASGAFAALIQKFASGIPVLRRFTGAQNAVSSGFGGGLKNVLKYAFGIRSLFALVNRIRSAAVEGFKNISQYSDETNSSLSMLMSSLTQLKNSIAAAFAPVLNVVAPILNTLIQKIISVFNVIGQLTSALTGKSTYMTARKVQQDYAKSLNSNAQSARNAQKANKDLQRTILGFDQINKMDDNSSADNGSGDTGSGGGLSPSDMFDTASIPSAIRDFSDKIKQAWKNADFTEIGSIVGDKLNRALSNIQWNKIQGTCNKIAKSIATFLNGFLEKTDWGLVGSTLSKGLNTVFGAANTFAKNFYWKSLGNAISDGINGAVRVFDAVRAGQAVSNTVKGILDAFITAVENTDWIRLGEKVKEVLVNIDWKGIVELLSEAIGAAFGGFSAFMGGLLADGFVHAKEYFQEEIEECGGNLVAGVFKGVTDAIANVAVWIYNHVFKPFMDGFCNAFGIHSPSTVMATQGGYIISGFLKGIKDSISQLLSYVAQIPAKVVGAIGDIAGSVRKKGADVVSGLKDGLTRNWSSFTSVVSSIPQKIKKAVPNLFSVGKSIIQNFAKGFGSVHIPMPHIGWDWKGGSITIGNWRFSLPRFNLSWYANGGFPDAGQLFVANEAGPEMVGKMGNRTTVANNNQIVEGIKAGVFEAVIEALEASGLLSKNDSGREVVLEFTLKADSETLYKVVRKGKRKYDYRYAVTDTF